MTDPVLYLSMILGLGDVYVLITYFNDVDDDSDEGESICFISNLQRREDSFNK